MNDANELHESGLRRPLEHLQSILIPSETLEAWAIERRLFALTHRRVLVAATSGRLIRLTRPLIGGFSITDIRWQDIEDVKLHVGIFGANLWIRAGKATDLASHGEEGAQRLEFHGLRKDQAQAVYRVCQAQDQAWRERRRIRELEEMRARSGGVHLTQGAGFGAEAPAAPDVIRRLQEAKQMLDAKLITDADYEAIKARIVSSA